MTFRPLIGQETVCQVIADALRLFVGRDKRYSVEGLAEASGVTASSLKAYRAGTHAPGLHHYLSLVAVLGPAFFNETIKHLRFSVTSLEASEISPHVVLSETCAAAAELSAMLADGRIDHTERPRLIAMLEHLRTDIDGLLAALRDAESGAA